MANVFFEQLTEEELVFFGLSDQPFDFIDRAGDIWLSDGSKKAVAKLRRGIERNRMLVLAGPVGAGKTTLLRYLVDGLLKNSANRLIFPDILDKKKLNGSHLLEMVLRELGEKNLWSSEAARTAQVKKMLGDCVESGLNPILIIDEAHDLNPLAFLALKRLWDSGVLFRLLAILLVGQGGYEKNGMPWGIISTLMYTPTLREVTERSEKIDLAEINGSLGSYVRWRLARAKDKDGQGDVFDSKALSALSRRARTPQLANILAVRAMREAMADGKRTVQKEHVHAG